MISGTLAGHWQPRVARLWPGVPLAEMLLVARGSG
jgi:hypothetical protein